MRAARRIGPRVDAVVPVEALVLDGDHRLAHVHRDLLERDDLAVLLGVERVHERAVGGVERGGLDLLRIGRVDGPRRVRARAERARDGEQAAEGAEGSAHGRRPFSRTGAPAPRHPAGSGWTGGAPGGDDVRLMPAAPDLLDDLDQRGLIHDTTDRAALAARLAEGPITLYYGCDPTAPSLHHGNLIGLIMLRRFQDAGHRPIALAGGATGMIGDPGGRSEERNLLDVETLAANVAAIKEQISRILGPEGRWMLVDNLTWTADVRLLDFLRDVGKHVTVNQMVARESVKARMASEHGISYTEFSYMLLQAFDYAHLHEHEGCELQIGGSDQWGNILSGVDLIRRQRGQAVHALCWPLLTADDGSKIGKTTGARVWLDPELTSPYAFFQHWINVDDAEVGADAAPVHAAPDGRDRPGSWRSTRVDPRRRAGPAGAWPGRSPTSSTAPRPEQAAEEASDDPLRGRPPAGVAGGPRRRGPGGPGGRR